jgi:hypothetical protein
VATGDILMPGQWITRIALLLALGVVGFGGEGMAAGTPAGEITATVQYTNPTEAAMNYLAAVGIRARVRTMERAAWLTAWKEKKIRGMGLCGAGGRDQPGEDPPLLLHRPI